MNADPTGEQVRSADGTTIAVHRYGSGAPVLLVGGALSTARASTPLAQALEAAGLQGVTMDRRGRGDSTDTAPYAPDREVEDLRAVIESLDRPTAVFGHSSGAVLAWLAAAHGVSMTHLFLSEPPVRFDDDGPGPELAARLQAHVDAGENEQAIVMFLRDNVGLPGPVIEQMRSGPEFEQMHPLARTTVYDTLLVDSASPPTPAMTRVGLDTIVLRGEPTMPMLVDAVERTATLLPRAELKVVTESSNHGVDPQATARLIADRIG